MLFEGIERRNESKFSGWERREKKYNERAEKWDEGGKRGTESQIV